jgi:hypothetical protein
MRLLALSLMLLSTSACKAPHIVVPSEIARASDEVAVTDRSSMTGSLANESFKLGSYAVDDVDRAWDKKSTVSLFGAASEKAEGSYRYKLNGGAQAFSGQCAAERAVKSWTVDSATSIESTFSNLRCTCGGASSPIKVAVSAADDGKASGELHTSAGSYEVQGIYQGDEYMFGTEPAGYRLESGQRRAAVETLRPGRAWFPRDIGEPERTELACLFAGLMLYLPPMQSALQ